MAVEMLALAEQQPGFLGVESACEAVGITISYWSSLDAIKAWKANERHLIVQRKGATEWYKSYRTRICLVEREYGVREVSCQKMQK